MTSNLENNQFPLGRLQWVFYRYPSDWCWGLHRFTGGLRHIYRWSFAFGPVELRHWAATGEAE